MTGDTHAFPSDLVHFMSRRQDQRLGHPSPPAIDMDFSRALIFLALITVVLVIWVGISSYSEVAKPLSCPPGTVRAIERGVDGTGAVLKETCVPVLQDH